MRMMIRKETFHFVVILSTFRKLEILCKALVNILRGLQGFIRLESSKGRMKVFILLII